MRSDITDKPVFHMAIIALLGLLIYSNTFSSPFQWDERYFIVDNPIVENIGYFIEPSKAAGLGQYDSMKSRYIGYLTFALNYQLHGFDVTGYHIVNLAIHILNAFLVYCLIIFTFRTPSLAASEVRRNSRRIALFSAILFVSHPLQVEAVTYVFQRLASLVTFFFLLSLVAYIRSRLSENNKEKYGLYAVSLVSAILAMKTKENAFTLPVVITLYELFFFRGSVKTRVLRLIPLLLSILIVPFTLVGIDRPAGEIISGLASVPRNFVGLTRWEYLLTQFNVIATYLRLLFLPINQNLDYHYPTIGSVFNPRLLFSVILLLAVFGVGVYLAIRSQTKHPALRLTAFGIFWFFITLSVESSVIPIPMVIDEYRVYLPSVGLLTAVVTYGFILFGRRDRWRMRIAAPIFLCLVPVMLASATYARNDVWADGVSLWGDVIKKSPGKARGYGQIALTYFRAGELDKAVAFYKTAIAINPNFTDAYNNLGTIYSYAGLTDLAVEHYETSLRLDPKDSMTHYNLATLYFNDQPEKAREHFEEALRIKPEFYQAHHNLGLLYLKEGLPDESIEHFTAVIRIRPDFVQGYFTLGRAYSAKGLQEKAIENFLIALRFRPFDPSIHHALANAYEAAGDVSMAKEHLMKAGALERSAVQKVP